MSKVLDFLGNLHLSLLQWLLLSASTVIGGLVIALKAQGSRLHKAQVQLLSIQYSTAIVKQDADVEKAKEAYRTALGLYTAKGGR